MLQEKGQAVLQAVRCVRPTFETKILEVQAYLLLIRTSLHKFSIRRNLLLLFGSQVLFSDKPCHKEQHGGRLAVVCGLRVRKQVASGGLLLHGALQVAAFHARLPNNVRGYAHHRVGAKQAAVKGRLHRGRNVTPLAAAIRQQHVHAACFQSTQLRFQVGNARIQSKI